MVGTTLIVLLTVFVVAPLRVRGQAIVKANLMGWRSPHDVKVQAVS